MNDPISEKATMNLRRILSAIRNETVPLNGHSDPGAIIDCWKLAFEELDLIESSCQSDTSALKEEIERLKERVNELNTILYDGRHYLMGVEPDEITVENSLESFGFGRNGLEHP